MRSKNVAAHQKQIPEDIKILELSKKYSIEQLIENNLIIKVLEAAKRVLERKAYFDDVEKYKPYSDKMHALIDMIEKDSYQYLHSLPLPDFLEKQVRESEKQVLGIRELISGERSEEEI